MRLFDRLTWIGIAFSLIAGLILFRLISIQKLAETLSKEPVYSTIVQPERGMIYDRDGHILAGNRLYYEVGVELNQVIENTGADTIAQETSRILGLDYLAVKSAASIPFDASKARYAMIEDFIEPSKISQLEQVKKQYKINYDPRLNGLYWYPYLSRSYPENSLASNVIGFFGFWDRLTGKPYFGIEEEYNDLLSGKRISVTYQLDPSRITDLPSIPPGADLVLTIDREIQAMVERILDWEVEKSGSVSGTILIMNPQTGEILAMAVNPRINPNQYANYAEMLSQGYSYNRAIDLNYEPGSVFKVITMAAALDADVVEQDTVFLDQGYFQVGGYTIYNWDRSAWGPQDMLGCLQHSLNVCLSWVAVEKLGSTRFYDYLDRFGIGHRTNIDLAGELVFPLSVPGDSNWSEVSLATNSFGQGLAVTPIQLATAVSALANGGKIMAPHVLKAVISSDQQFTIQPKVIANPISAATAKTLSSMLVTSLEREASSALVEGYRVAGKTGTAEIAVENLGYITDLTNASFVGWGPVDDPQFLVYIWLEQPTSSPWGSVVAAPVFKKVVSELVLLMNIPPDDIRRQLASQ